MSEGSKKRKRSRMRRKPPGSSPGTIVVDPSAHKPKLTVIAFGPNELVEKTITSPSEVCPLLERYPVVWLDVDGLGDAEMIRSIGDSFRLHRLALEDVTEVHKRARVDRYDTHLYIALVMVNRVEGALDTEQLSLFLGHNFVITLQERPGDGFDRVRERIRGGKGLIRTGGPGYLAYALLDATIDGYFPVLEHYGEQLEELEDALVTHPDSARLHEIHGLRRDLVLLRRAIWPMREALNFLLREGHDFFTSETRPYLNDCYDHTVQLMDLVENHREMASGLMDVYLSAMSNRMNEIMKVLTIISTIFMPLTFIAGVYGMNFRTDAGPLSMPELLQPYGYVIVMGVMLAISLTMLLFFRRKGWLGERAQVLVKREREKEPRRRGLERILSKLGVCSRNEANTLIRRGRVRVNGVVILDPEAWFDPERDEFELDGRAIVKAKKLYYALHKPRGYITTRSDPGGRMTVYELLGAIGAWVVPVGRLDLDTSGLLLFTNDTHFADLVSSPASHVPKTYRVECSPRLDDESLAQLARGVTLSDGPTRPALVRAHAVRGKRSRFEITITEGRNRIVRRMVREVGAKVEKLVRVSIGPLELGDLASGALRPLTESEVRALTSAGASAKRRAARE